MIVQGHPQAAQMEAVLVQRNERLIWNVVHRYRHTFLEKGDLFVEGVCGFLHAIRRWQPERNLRLTTYAVHWIRQHIGRAVEQGGAIRVPSHAHEFLPKVKRAMAELGPQAGEQELSEATGLKLASVRTALMAIEIEQLYSLDSPVHEDGSPLSDLVALVAPSTEHEALARVEALELQGLVARLPDKQRQVIQSRIMGDATLSEAGEIVGLSRERARQLEVMALKTLKGQVTR